MLLKNCKIVDANGVRYGDIRVSGSDIAEVGDNLYPQEGEESIPMEGKLVMPSFIDLNCRVLDDQLSQKNLNRLIEEALEGGFGDVVLQPDSSPQIKSEATVEFVHSSGGTRISLVPSLLAIKDDFTMSDISILSKMGCKIIHLQSHKAGVLIRRVFEYALMRNNIVACSCNDISMSEGGVMNEGSLSSKLGLPGISSIFETKEVAKLIEFAYSTGVKVLFNALSSPRSLEIIDRAKKQDKLRLYSEVSIHHLILSEDACEDYNTSAKIMPPLQSKATKDTLINALKSGKIDCLTSLNSPKSISKKDMAFESAEYGVGGIGLFFALCYTYLHKQRGLGLDLLSKVLSFNQANILGLKNRALIKEGFKADIAVIDESVKVVIEDRHSPYFGRELESKVVALYKDGVRVF